MRSSDFMRAVPVAAREKLPASLQTFKTVVRPWLVQLYYGHAAHIHYEVWLLSTRFQRAGERGIEVGLHFESRDAEENRALLTCCYEHLFEIKAELGHQVEAEPWDKGWTKCYETFAIKGFDDATLDHAAERLARFIVVLQPLIASEREPAPKAGARRKR